MAIIKKQKKPWEVNPGYYSSKPPQVPTAPTPPLETYIDWEKDYNLSNNEYTFEQLVEYANTNHIPLDEIRVTSESGGYGDYDDYSNPVIERAVEKTNRQYKSQLKAYERAKKKHDAEMAVYPALLAEWKVWQANWEEAVEKLKLEKAKDEYIKLKKKLKKQGIDLDQLK